MRSLIIIAALSFASFGLAQGDAPEAPPLHPPEPDDEAAHREFRKGWSQYSV